MLLKIQNEQKSQQQADRVQIKILRLDHIVRSIQLGTQICRYQPHSPRPQAHPRRHFHDHQCALDHSNVVFCLFRIFGNIAKNAAGDRPLIPWFNELLIALERGNAGFVGTFVFAYLCLFMVWCVQKGNIKFGIRLPFCCRFHPMK